MPPWKKRQRKGREAKKKGKICGFDAGISPWGMAGCAGAGWYWDPERFQNVCNVPQDPISSNPSLTVLDKLGGIRGERSGRKLEAEKSRKERKVDGTGESGTEWIRRVITEVEEGNNKSDKEVPAITSLDTPFS